VTIILNRSLFRLCKADVKHSILAGNSAIHRATSPFGLCGALAGPYSDREVLDEFDDIKTEVDDELNLKPFEILSRRPREIAIRLGKTGK